MTQEQKDAFEKYEKHRELYEKGLISTITMKKIEKELVEKMGFNYEEEQKQIKKEKNEE